ncbi:hypothetical protein DM01DRAFT_360054 [Hesseltinella vesiculosa]|uniref:SAC domain-containing protein n=1 Tax=Hesseltinella vesiculosa TaxID=101127 RepID=A0A1X2GPX4_9FUNG|nr:hypothetical protein DM01DRAFT_360054 [Hesseltinella vesiculosa]
MMAHVRHDKLRLTTTPSSFLLSPWDQEGPTVMVDRISKRLQLIDAVQGSPANQLNSMAIYGLVGFIQLQADAYMIVITGRTHIGALFGHPLYRVTTFQILPIGIHPSQLSSSLLDEEQNLILLLESHLRLNSFYFSCTYDLTNSLQRQGQQVDDRFFWNRYLASQLIDASADNMLFRPFILPLVHGFIHITTMTISYKQMTFALISRRSNERAGTRYFSRGIDQDGHVSNFVETEQCMSFIDITGQPLNLSFLQIRGSIPLFWGQIPNARYVPRLWYEPVISSKATQSARLHFEDQLQRYGSLVLVNLINKVGYEQPLGDLFARTVRDLAYPHIRYIHFDFHLECRKMQWHNLDKLTQRLDSNLAQYGFFQSDSSGLIKKSQVGIVRSNCMDCLDRTNVVQSKVGMKIVEQWQELIGTNLATDPLFVSIFNAMWSDNADALSMAYSGTQALKTDYTRYGKRTLPGMWNDLVSSLTRYFKNNFTDGSRQDSIDLFLGKLSRDPAQHIKLVAAPRFGCSLWLIHSMPAFLMISFLVFFWLLFYPIDLFSSTWYVLMLALCFTISVFSWNYILMHGPAFVDWPKLNPLYPEIIMNMAPPPPPSSSSTLSKHKNTQPSLARRTTETLDQVEQGKKIT